MTEFKDKEIYVFAAPFYRVYPVNFEDSHPIAITVNHKSLNKINWKHDEKRWKKVEQAIEEYLKEND